MGPLAIVGGTGPQGLGLALRFAAAGEGVIVGSRDLERAREVAGRVRATVVGARVEGWTNDDAIARTDRVILTIPFAGLSPFLEACAPALAGKLVIDVIVPIAREAGVFVLAPVPGAQSVSELIQRTAPAARVVCAFKNHPAAALQRLDVPLCGDVVLCGDHAEARAAVAALVARLPGMRAVDAGDLANARSVEAVTPLLLSINRRHGALTSIAILGLPDV